MEPSISYMPPMRVALMSLSDSSFGNEGAKYVGKVQPKDHIPVPISSLPPREISTRLLRPMKKSVGMKVKVFSWRSGLAGISGTWP
jgi:hypothetical protein